ncbi:Ig-like domain-containing protein [Alteromonas sp. 1_MG-2023]|uniref:Ig-like domain-containing protein n=1 Tax=Alteromonas sp. 1_MG-2023 TaxID=3062669 RepID=UPI0026E22B2B|nr:Ig-like domain-containing protein [Alteromonas sp. 1_MG-2023]MDO6477295.1 Ig-like domain-containing protein [Alteromonas sp. 1_MG-2023]
MKYSLSILLFSFVVLVQSAQSRAASITINEDSYAQFLASAYSSGTGWILYEYSNPSHGTVSQPHDQGIRYTPSPNYCGSDSFIYKVRKNSGGGTGPGPGLNLNSLREKSDADEDLSNREEQSSTFSPVVQNSTSNKELQTVNGYSYSTVTVNMTIKCINDRPAITNIANQSTNEDVNKTINFSISDVETSANSLRLSRSSTNTSLLPVGNIVLGGSGKNRTVTLKPAANKSGSSTVSLTVSDGKLSKTDTFVLTVNAVNDRPTITNIQNQSTNEDINKTISFSISDVETSANSLTLSRSSSNTSLLPVSNVILGGSGNNRTVTLKPAANKSGSSTVSVTVSDGNLTKTDTFVLTVNAVNDRPTISNIPNQSTNEDINKTVNFSISDVETSSNSLVLSRSSSNTSLLPTGNVILAGSGNNRSLTLKPVANKSGSSTVSVTVSDGKLTKTDTFVLTVNAVNDGPTISNIPNQSTNEDTNKTVSFTVNDIDNSANSLTVSRSSSNTSLLPVSNVILGGSGNNRTVTLKPAANKSGSSTVSVTVSDGNLTKTDTFVLTVNAVNDRPTISNIPNQSTNEDINKTVNFSISDVETSSNSLVLSRSSSNTSLLPTGNVILAGSGNNRSLTLKPVANKSGSSTVSVTVSDGKLTKTVTFVLTVNAVNDAPTLAHIPDQKGSSNSVTSFSFSVDDVDTPLSDLTFSAASSSQSILSNSSISVTGTGNNRTLHLAPQANAKGATTVTLTVSDGSKTAQRSFDFSVIELWSAQGGNVNDAPYYAPSYSPSTYTPVGTIFGEHGVSGGQATYSIPIPLPPGRAGMKPDIALTYNSQSPNGLVGAGFTLSYGGGISRCAKTVAHDGRASNPQYVVSDALCLNGSRLVLTSGSQGYNGSVYRTELDQFSRIELLGGNINSTSSYFKVTEKSGATAFYGSTSSSKVTLDGLSSPASWLLDKRTDSTNKNYVHYNYKKYGAAEVIIDNIRYTGNSVSSQGNRTVSFDYVLRDDKRTGYSFGGYFEHTVLLSSITTKVASDPIFNFSLRYKTSAATGRSLLDAIQQCNASSECYPATGFDWQDNPFSYELERLTVNNSEVLTDLRSIDQAMPYGDINGDGAVDWPGYYINADRKGSSHDFELSRCSKDYLSMRQHCISGDFNNDGLTDGWMVTSRNILRLEITNGHVLNTGISLPEGLAGTNIKDSQISDIRDYNGDGFADLMIKYFNGSTVSLRLYEHSGNVNRPYTSSDFRTVYTYKMQGSGTQRSLITEISFIGDLDGNGFPDLVEMDYYATHSDNLRPLPRPLKQLLNNGNNFTSGSFPFGLIDPVDFERFFFSQFIDVNGDGLLDWIGYEDNTSPQTKLSLNLGGGSYSSSQDIDINFEQRSYRTYDQSSGEVIIRRYPKYAGGLKVQDINMDGIPELLVPGERLLEACAKISQVSGSSVSTATKCGNQLYSAVRMSPSSNDTTPINVEEADASVYQFNAYSFSTDSSGNVTATLGSTDIVGNAYESAMVDAYGEGFTDMVFVLGIKSALDSCPEEGSYAYLKHSTAIGVMSGRECEYGVYVNRNRGSATSSEDYAATDVLASVTNGIGMTASWEYKPLSSSIEKGAAGAELYSVDERDVNDPDHFHFSSSMYVVRQMSADNGVNGTFDTLYAYRGAMYNNKGRGFRGFRTIVVENVNKGVVTQTDFRQKFPYSGVVQGTHTFASNTYESILNGLNYSYELYSLPDFDYSGTVENNAANFGAALSSVVSHWSLNTKHWDNTNNSSCATIWNSEYAEYDLDCPNGLRIFSIYQNHQQRVTRDPVTANILSDTSIEILDIDRFGNTLEVTTTSESDYGNRKKTVRNTYEYNEAAWQLSQLSSTRETNFKLTNRAGTDPYSSSGRADLDKDSWVEQHFTNYHPSRKPQQISTTTSNGEAVARTNVVVTAYNDFGLPTNTSTTADIMSSGGVWSAQTRSEIVAYSSNNSSPSADGYFPFRLTNSLNQVSYVHFDSRFGEKIKDIDPNGLTVETVYDGFGRVSSGKSPGMPRIYEYYDGVSGDSNAPSYARWKRVSISAGSPQQTIYYDLLGRELRSGVQGFDGTWINQDTAYNNEGYKVEESLPFGSGKKGTTTFSAFDVLGRPGEKVMPNGLTIDYIYEDQTTFIEAGSLDMQRIYNDGQLVETIDALNGKTRYAYSGRGHPIVIQDANSNSIFATYNALGQKVKVEDPNQGTSTYVYNGFGELEQEVTANSETIRYEYDKLGRLIEKTARTGSGVKSTFKYTFDSELTGYADQEIADGVVRSFDYDSKGRLNRSTLAIGSETFTTEYFIDDAYGRVKGTKYPNNVVIEQRYNQFGYTTHFVNAYSDYVYQHIQSMDQFLNVTASQLGNGVQEDAYYLPETGLADHIRAKKGNSWLHHMNYSAGYDNFGNLIESMNVITGMTMNYEYDSLHRLEGNTISGWGSSERISYSYDAVGNLLSKSDYAGTYRYGNANRSAGGNAGSNAVRQIVKGNSTVNFLYDNMGNMTSGDGVSLAYNAYRQPVRIVRNGTTFDFTYDANLERVKEVRNGIITYEIDKVFEKSSDGSWSLYIADIAVLKYSNSDGHSIFYRHKDRLGSALTFTDENGNVSGRRAFDPFGKPRAENGSSLSVPRLTFLNDSDQGGRRGFTDHRHLDEAQLIHMNGRVYDYNLGRFLSVDPFIQDPTNSQSINPYSYIMNNPLMGTDPSGYVSEIEGRRYRIECSSGRCPEPSDSSGNGGDGTQEGESGSSNGPNGEGQPDQPDNGHERSSDRPPEQRDVVDTGNQDSIAKSNNSGGGFFSSASGFVKQVGQSFLDGQARSFAGGIGIQNTEDINSSINIPISGSEAIGAENAQSVIEMAGIAYSSIIMLANLRNAEFTPSKEMIMGSLSLLVKDGKINISELKSFIPNGIADTFDATARLPVGSKFKFFIGDHKVILRWHSPDKVAKQKFPNSASGNTWTAQIQVHNRHLMTNGEWTKNNRKDATHIPIVWE